jgi:hypothetical protein
VSGNNSLHSIVHQIDAEEPSSKMNALENPASEEKKLNTAY